MPNNLESIIKDLYELDPTLRSEDKVVREVVASLLANKPVVLPDQAYVANLRSMLVATNLTKVDNNRPVLSPWLMYFAPIGVVAILVFMMVPKPLSHQVVPTVVNDNVELDSASAPKVESNFDAPDPKRSFIAPEESPVGGDMRTMELAMPVEVSGETFSISTQLTGQVIKVDYVSFTEPTFLVIQKDRDGMPGEVVGVSQALNEQLEAIEIALMAKMLKNETFFATAYRDNGDGIYTPGNDSLVYDASGAQPLQQMFSTSPF